MSRKNTNILIAFAVLVLVSFMVFGSLVSVRYFDSRIKTDQTLTQLGKDTKQLSEDSKRNSEAAKEQSEHNATLLRIMLAVTGCTADDTAEECYQRQVDRSITEGVVRLTEVDCIIRRALAGISSPRPGVSCISQTPGTVYPGTS